MFQTIIAVLIAFYILAWIILIVKAFEDYSICGNDENANELLLSFFLGPLILVSEIPPLFMTILIILKHKIVDWRMRN